MDNIDNLFGAETSPVSMDEIIGTDLPPMSAPPIGAVRNRAAATAMLSDDPTKAVDNYRAMMLEGSAGQQAIIEQNKAMIEQSAKQENIQGVMSVLSDPKIPFEQKQAVIKNFNSSPLLKDTYTTLQSKVLTKPSQGESFENEDARITAADAIGELYQARERIQGLVNAHGASLDDAGLETVADMAALWVLPFGNSASSAKIGNKVAQETGGKTGLWDSIKRALLPGTTTADLRKRLENLPAEQRVEYARTVLAAIKGRSGVIFSNDNQFAQYQKAEEIFGEGGYSGVQEFVDNITPLLDLVGIGQIGRGVNRAARAVGGSTKASEAAGEAARGWRPGSNAGEASDVPFREVPGTAIAERFDEVTPIPGRGVGSATPPARPYQTELPNPQKRLPNIEDEVKRIELNSVVRKENPASPAGLIQQVNPQSARDIHATVVKSSDDQVAEGLYGTSRDQAIINDVYPQVDSGSGAVMTKARDIDRNLRREMQVSDDVTEALLDSGAIYYTRAEKASVRANIVNDFQSAAGLNINDAMSSFKLDGGTVNIGAVYGAGDGSFLRAEDAIQQAKYALRKYGIRDDEIEILQKQGLDHVPVKLDEVAGRDGDFLVRVTTKYEIGADDVLNFEAFDVKRNTFDRVAPLVWNDTGSVTRWLFDAASTLHPTITGAASVASDATARFEKVMLQKATDFSDIFAKLPEGMKGKVNEYIKEANFNGLKFDQADLMARGFSQDAIEGVRNWRSFWDQHYYLENYDMVRSLKAQGFAKFENANTTLYAKPVAKNQNIGKMYDPLTDSVVFHSKADGDALYDAGGTYAKLRRPADINGESVDYMLVRNTPSEYLSGLRDTDRVLNYREGYFQVQYKAPKFVEEIIRDGKGVETGRKAVAVAGDTREAEFFAERMRKTTGKEYVTRGDARALPKDDDAWWDVNSAAGRIAQRHRGKILEDATGLNHLGDANYVVNPVESAKRAAMSISGRTVNRPMLEAAKARAMSQYGDLFPSNGFGGKRWPNSVGEIGKKGEHSSKELADARTTYEYVNYLENGYINGMDVTLKAAFNALSEAAGRVSVGAGKNVSGLNKVERALQKGSEGAGISGIAKNVVFMSYIGSNPIRQWIVQPHQVLRTLAYNPTGWATGSIPRFTAQYISDVIHGTESEFTKFITSSGMLDAVDKSNLVRGTLLSAADQSPNPAAKAVGVARQVGFDIGEQANLLGHSAAVFDRYKRLGRDLSDKAVRDAAYSEIRAISYDMNFAGDMAYNQSSASSVLQFMQVPHKAFLQITNRRIPMEVRARMLIADYALWGPPTAIVAAVYGDILPEDPQLREAVQFGLESMFLNNMFQTLFEDDTRIDFSSIAPFEANGWEKFFTNMWQGGLGEVLANSPSGQLFFKEGGRFRNAMASMARYFGVIDDIDETPEEFSAVMDQVAKISSAYSNAVKAKIMLETGKKVDQYGRTIDSSATKMEAWAQALGFPTADARDFYAVSQKINKDMKADKEEALRIYADIKRYYADNLQTDNSDIRFVTKVTSAILKAVQDDPYKMQVIRDQISKDMVGPDQTLMRQMLQRAGLVDSTGFRDQINSSPLPEDTKQKLRQIANDADEARKTLKENK